MRYPLRYVLALATLLMLVIGTPVAGAGTGQLKYTEVVVEPTNSTGCIRDVGCPVTDGIGNLVVSFDEGGLKGVASVDYQLDALASSIWLSPCTGQGIGVQFPANTKVTGLIPDAKGHVVGSATLDLKQGPLGLLCGFLHSASYSDVTLTNLVTGDVYNLDAVSRTYP